MDYNYTVQKRKVLNILIIDDDLDISETLQDFLESRGHYVETVNEGTRGLTKNFNENYDIIFIDYHLDLDGASNVIKSDLQEDSIINGAGISEILNVCRNKTLLFGFTGDSSEIAINKFKKAGVDGIIFKPVEPEILTKLMLAIETKNEFDKISFGKAVRTLKNNIMIFI